jgi:hypothetical protein
MPVWMWIGLGFEHSRNQKSEKPVELAWRGHRGSFLRYKEEAIFDEMPALKVAFALFTSQVKENELHFLPYSDFWFLLYLNP